MLFAGRLLARSLTRLVPRLLARSLTLPVGSSFVGFALLSISLFYSRVFIFVDRFVEDEAEAGPCFNVNGLPRTLWDGACDR